MAGIRDTASVLAAQGGAAMAADQGPAVLVARRKALLEGQPALESLSDELFEQLATELREETFAPGDVVVAEGEPGDRFYVIAEGRAEVSAHGPDGPLPLATLSPGELFGEVALLRPDALRTATVTALTPLLALSLDARRFTAILADYPEARAAFRANAETLEAASFLKEMSPFATLDGPRLRALAAHLKRRNVPAGEEVVRQGEAGRHCFLIRSGQVEVLVDASDGVAGHLDEVATGRVATMGPGEVFGEAELLAGGTRSATVRALVPCEILELHRFDLLAVIGEDQEIRERMRELLRQHARPRQVPGIVAHRHEVSGGAALTTLQDAARGEYYRLSPQGRFIWDRLDGLHTLQDLERTCRAAFGPLDLDVILEIVGGLAAAGFVTGGTVRPELLHKERPTLSRRVGRLMRRVVGGLVRR
jgi:CRP-like cAMP-binding protein